MKKRFLNRARYPYLQTSLPENILPSKGLNDKEARGVFHFGPRPSKKGVQPSRSLLLRARRGRIGIYSKMMAEGVMVAPRHLDAASTPLEALEHGSMLSMVNSLAAPSGVSLVPPAPTAGGDHTRIWARVAQDAVGPGSLCPPGPPHRRGLLPVAGPPLVVGAGGVKQSSTPARRHTLRGVRARGRFYQSIYQLEGGTSKRHERRLSQVSLRLSERRKLRILYGGLSNKEVDVLIRKGFIGRGRLSDNVFKLLESRLDVLLWRIGFFPTLPAARNWVCCGRVLINNKVLTIANYLLQPGDVVSISPRFLTSLRKSMTERYGGGHGIDDGRGNLQTVRTSSSLPIRRRTMQEGIRWLASKGVATPPSFNGFIGAPRLSRGRLPTPKQTGRRPGLGWFSIKPSHVEISYLCLVAIYLYPPQRVFLPAPIDVETIRRW